MKKYLTEFRKHLSVFSQSSAGKILTKTLSIGFTLLIVSYLIFKLTKIGWREVLDSLPTTPWFYIILVLMFFSLPVFQVFIYGLAWKKPRFPLFPALLKKQVLDKNLFDLSGDMYLYFWARKHLQMKNKDIFHVLKDNVILSSAASTLVAVVLLIAFICFGLIALPNDWNGLKFNPVVVLILVVIFIFALFFKFRKSIFFLEKKVILYVLGLYVVRFLLIFFLQVIQWVVVLPEVPLIRWFTLLAVQIITSRIPLFPNRDLIFFGVGLEVSQWMGIPFPEMAGMLLASSVLNKSFNLVSFMLVSLSFRKDRPRE